MYFPRLDPDHNLGLGDLEALVNDLRDAQEAADSLHRAYAEVVQSPSHYRAGELAAAAGRFVQAQDWLDRAWRERLQAPREEA